MFKIERTVELTETGAIVHKRLVTPLFYVKLKSVEFELQKGPFKYISMVVDFLIPMPIPVLCQCDKRHATHEGSRWLRAGKSIDDHDFLTKAFPKKISKISDSVIVH